MSGYGELADTMRYAPDYYSSYLNSLLGTYQVSHLAEDRKLAMAKAALAQELDKAQMANYLAEADLRKSEAAKNEAAPALQAELGAQKQAKQAADDEAKRQANMQKAVKDRLYMRNVADVLAGPLGGSDTSVTPRDENGNPTGPSFNPVADFGQMAALAPGAQNDLAQPFRLSPEAVKAALEMNRGPYEQAWADKQAKIAMEKTINDQKQANEAARIGISRASNAETAAHDKAVLDAKGQEKPLNPSDVLALQKQLDEVSVRIADAEEHGEPVPQAWVRARDWIEGKLAAVPGYGAAETPSGGDSGNSPMNYQNPLLPLMPIPGLTAQPANGAWGGPQFSANPPTKQSRPLTQADKLRYQKMGLTLEQAKKQAREEGIVW